MPGAAERIVRMAEAEGEHRRLHEKLAVQANIDAQARQLAIAETQTKLTFRSDSVGQYLGAIVSLASIGCGFYLALHGAEWAAMAFVGLPLAAIIRAFKLGKNEPSSSSKSAQ